MPNIGQSISRFRLIEKIGEAPTLSGMLNGGRKMKQVAIPLSSFQTADSWSR